MNFKATLTGYKELFDKELNTLLEEELSRYENKTVKQNISLLKEYILPGGKRLRPIAAMMAYKAFSSNEKLMIRPALFIEFFHNYTLIFDDLMDEDDYRRGREGVQKKLKNIFLSNNNEKRYDGAIFSFASKRYAASISMLLGLICDTLSRRVIVENQFPDNNKIKALAVLNDLSRIVAEGQLMDIQMESLKEIKEEDYLEMIQKKTASLFISAIEIGALFGNADPEQINRLKDYALNISTAFQIQDDILDISSELKKGHDLGSDIKKGKRTLLVIKAFERADEHQKRILLDILGRGNATSSEVLQVVKIFSETGAKEYCQNLAEDKIQNGKDMLTKLDLNQESKEFFMQFADYMSKRAH
ncbi:polyprenyl synthetase family protein [Candidatus Woesearchaeota archaeon]|nr:polyprenyl synthetase family protein [Candidatus Woesearchaeota archaeon]